MKQTAQRTTAPPLGVIARLAPGVSVAPDSLGVVSRAAARLADPPASRNAIFHRRPPVVLSVVDVNPQITLERRPMSIRFNIRNSSEVDLYGTVLGVLGAPDFTIWTPIRPGETRGAEMICVAPDAGTRDVELAFFARADPAELGTPAAVSGPPASIDVVTVATAARYMVSFDSIHIDRTRAVHEDTDFASLSVSAGAGAPLTANRSLGDLNDGDHQVNLQVGPFDIVPGSADDLVISYLVVNAGHAAATSTTVVGILNKISDGTEEALDKVYPALSGVWQLLNALTHWLNEHLSVDCDGPVVSDKIVLSSSWLADTVAIGTSWGEPQPRLYPGSDSNIGCGKNSIYTARYSITRQLTG